MKIRSSDAIAKLVEGYRALEDDGGFIASEMNNCVGDDLFSYDDDEDEIVIDKEVVKTLPHIRVEYDETYWGGDYDKVGDIVFIPEALTLWYDNVEDAFAEYTGISAQHIIYYSKDERFRHDGYCIFED